MGEMLHVSSNPHVRDRMTTAKIMQMVFVALLPAAAVGVWNFGLRALLVLCVSVLSAVCSEWVYDHFMHKPNTVKDWSAAVTGLLLGMNMPVSIPLCFCNYCCKAAVWRIRTELYESCSGCQMFPVDFFFCKDDRLFCFRQF